MIGLGTIINVDAEKTRQYYQAMGPGELCSCNDYKNYCARVKVAYPAAAEYLAGLGVEIEKPLETSPLEPGADGMMEYRACQYVVLGSCEENYRHTIGGVEVCKARFYPETGVKEEHFVLELSPIRLKGWQE